VSNNNNILNMAEHDAISVLGDRVAELIAEFEQETGRIVESIKVRHGEIGDIYPEVNLKEGS
jgi:hypothetical protein